METIFDHDPTPDERRYLTGPHDAEQYRQVTTEDQAAGRIEHALRHARRRQTRARLCAPHSG